MTIADLGSVGEFVSSIAVVLSLVYLAFQIRQNSKETRMASRQSMLEASRDMILQVAKEDNADLTVRFQSDPNSLSETERFRFMLICTARLRNIENAFLMRLDNVIDDDVFAIFEEQARRVLRVAPDILESDVHSKKFKDWMETLN